MKNMNPKFGKALKGTMLGAGVLMMAAFIVPKDFYTPVFDSPFTKELKSKTELYTSHFTEERVYVQFDKPMYEPGETIWFSAFIRDGVTLKKSKVSDVLHVELINPKGSVEKKITIVAKDGMAAGDFTLDPEMAGGMYKVHAYTKWMKNGGENNVFEKEFQVQDVVLPNLKMKLEFMKKGFGPGDEVIAKLQLNTNENQPLSNYDIKYVCELQGSKYMEKAEITDDEGVKFIKFKLPKELNNNDGLLNVMISYNGNTESVSGAIPILLNKVAIKFFPEGGDLVEGLESNVAFRATNEYGKPADIDGVVVTEKGSTVSTFSSFHQGMGAFKLIPQNNEKYFVKITRPAGINEQYELPSALETGYVLNTDASRDGEITATINSSTSEELSVIAQVREKIYYSNTIKAVKGTNKVTFPTDKFPAGVAQVTVFDSKGIARCERLAFVNRNRQLSVTVETEKEKYLPREKVKLNLTVKDEKGFPVPADLSLSVVNDQLISFANSKQGNILSQLLFQQDLKQKIEDPAFYFDKKEAKAPKALDFLLMTAGYRQFTWEKVQKGNFPAPQFAAEKAIVAGVVMDYQGRPVKNATIKTSNGREFKADTATGKFRIWNLEMYEPVTLTFSAPDCTPSQQTLSDYNQNIVAYIYNPKSLNNGQPYTYTWATPTVAANADVLCVGANMNCIGNAMGAGHFAVVNNAVPAKPGAYQVKVNDANGCKGKAVANVPQRKEAQEKAAAKNVEFEKKEEKKLENVAKLQDNKKPQAEMNRVVARGGLNNVRFNNINNANGIDVGWDFGDGPNAMVQQGGNVYYRAKKFAAPVYDKQETVETRTDFRNTIYFNPDVKVGYTGKASVEFYASDDITSFRATVEGLSKSGLVGREEKTFFTQLPFAMSTKIPVEVATEDVVSIPLTLKNNTNGPLGGVITITKPDGFQELVKIPEVQTIMPGAAKTIFLDYKVLDKIGYGDFTVAFKSCGLGDAFTQQIKIAPKGFPATASFSGQEKEKEYSFNVQHLVSGSLKANVTIYPNVVSDLLKGVEGILREPSGCFEQTSMSSYPNAMVLDYLKATDSKDEATVAKASALLDRGYKKLTTFETTNKGYEWFGSNPGHEALTAYGLMQFADMKRVGEAVDAGMLDRTANWLMSKKTGNGGFSRDSKALDNFGRASEEVTNAYIVYSLSEAGYGNIKKEFNASYDDAMKNGDSYVLALMANASYNYKENDKGNALLEKLLKKQKANGSFDGGKMSITCSTGESLVIETSSLAIMAILKSPSKSPAELTNSVKWLMSARNGYGAFGNTQGTVLALKALTEFAKYSRKTTEDGTVVVYIDGKKAGMRAYKAGEKDAIVIDGLESMVKGEGKHDVKVKFEGVKNPLPYSVGISWSTTLPESNKDCAVDLKTKMASPSVLVGETNRFTATITNKKAEGIPSTMVIIGIPAGFTAQPWQLKELQDKKVFDYYEINGNNIAIYYRCMAPSMVKEINLDLKAEMPGVYDAPASSAYLYYTNELKSWAGLDKITVKKS